MKDNGNILHMNKAISDIQSTVNGMAKDFTYLSLDVKEIKATLEKDYVTQDKHARLEDEVRRLGKIVYFACSVLAGAILIAIANLVINKP